MKHLPLRLSHQDKLILNTLPATLEEVRAAMGKHGAEVFACLSVLQRHGYVEIDWIEDEPGQFKKIYTRRAAR